MRVTFHDVTGKLVRRVQIDRDVFLDQLMSRGWTEYFGRAASAHSENRIEVREAVRRLQVILPKESEPIAERRLYEFDLQRILHGWGIRASLGEEAGSLSQGLRIVGYSDGSIQVADN